MKGTFKWQPVKGGATRLIEKSSRHSHIIGKFGESMLCNWLSRTGFEVAIVDHTGIDIVAFNPKTGQRLGITVKSRTRVSSDETSAVYIFGKPENERGKLEDACRAFGCEPWIAVYVETEEISDVYLTSLSNYDNKYRGEAGRAHDTWRMSVEYKERYKLDKEVKHVHATFDQTGWTW